MELNTWEFSSDLEVEAFNDGDRAVDITGYVDMIDGVKVLSSSRKAVFKFVLNNGSKERMRVLIWGTDDVEKYKSLIQLNSVIAITGGNVKLSNPVYRNPKEDVNLLEYHVQTHSTLQNHGDYAGNSIGSTVRTFKQILMADLMSFNEPVEFDAFVKTPFYVVNTKNSSYGQGVVCDGHYRLVVKIASFTDNKRMLKGVHLKLKGRMNKLDGGCFKVTDVDDIDILEDKIMENEDLKASIYNVLYSKKRKLSVDEQEESSKKMHLDEEK